MDSELDNKQQNASEQAGSRDGAKQQEGQTEGRPASRPMRPRIHTQRAYSSDNRGGASTGFRPEGFGSALGGNGSSDEGAQRPRTSYRPRFNSSENAGSGYGQRPQQGFRPRYNSNSQDGDHRPAYGQRPQQGYRPRYNSNASEGGEHRPSYGQRPQQGSYGQRPQQGFRPRYNSNGEGNDHRPAYGQRPQQGGYGQRPQQGFRPRYGSNGEGNDHRPAYGQRPQGGYGQRQPGGYGQRQQGGYGRQKMYRQHTADYDPNAKYSMKKRIEYAEENVDPTAPIRLNKFLANAGICSRREADEFIQAGAVTVNGNVVTELGTKVTRADEIKFHDTPVTLEKKVYVLLNKPKDYVTTSDDPQQRKTVMDLVKDACPERIYPVGRLDRNTTGVLLLTNDGDLASKLTHPKFLKKKVYHAFLDHPLSEEDMQKIAEGIELEDGEVHADAIDYPDEQDKTQVGIEIHSGKNRIVRRIFEHLGYRVIRLDRVQFAGLTKKNLRRGDWRFLTQKEVEMLRNGMFE